MALIRPSALIGAISGTIQGITFANAKSASIVRPRQPSRHNNTKSQLSNRAAFISKVSQWRAATDANRTAWNNAATQVTIPNSLGIPRTLSGFQYFLWRHSGETFRPADDLSWPPTLATPIPGNTPSFSFPLGTIILFLTSPAGGPNRAEVWITLLPTSAPLNFSNNWRLSNPKANVPSAVFLASFVASHFGTPRPGQRIGAKVHWFNIDSRYTPATFVFTNIT